MSQFTPPPAQGNTDAAIQFAYGDEGPAGPPARVSVLAVGSLVFSLVCCLPGTGVIGTGLGIGAIFNIGKSQGRLSGQGMAVAGIVLGMLSSMVQVGLMIGGNWMLRNIERNLSSPTAALITHVQAGDFGAARMAFTAGAGAGLSDADLRGFGEALTARLGAFVDVEKLDLSAVLAGLRKGADSKGPRGANLRADQFVFPLPQTFRFEKGSAVAALVMDDPDALYNVLFNGKSVEGALVNMGLMLEDGTVVWVKGP